MNGKKTAGISLALLLALTAVFPLPGDALGMVRAGADGAAQESAEEAPSGPPEEEAVPEEVPGGNPASEADGDPEPGERSVPEAEGDTDIAPEPESAGAFVPEPGAGLDGESVKEPGTESAEASVPESGAGLDGEPAKEPGTESDEASVPESGAGLDVEPAKESGTESDRASVWKPESESCGMSGSEPETKEDRISVPEPESEPDGASVLESEPDGASLPERQAQAGTDQVLVSGGEEAEESLSEPEEQKEAAAPDRGKARSLAAARASYPLYIKTKNVVFEDGAGGTILRGAKNSHEAVEWPAGTPVTFPHCPVLGFSCRYCGGRIYWMAPMVYGDQTMECSDPAVLRDISCVADTWTSGDGMNGSQCMHLSCASPRPGSTEVKSHYYVRYDRYSASGGICPWCWSPMKMDNRGIWYECEDTFSISVYADYVLEYDANAEEDPVSGLPEAVDRRAYTDSVDLILSDQVPQREGYTFQGWAEQKGALTEQYDPEDPVTLEWTEGPEVKKILYAVWEKEEQSTGVFPPDTDDLKELSGFLVRVHCIDEDAGHPDKRYGADAGDAGEEAFEIGAVYVQEEGSFCDVRLDGTVFAGRYSLEPEIGTVHELAEGEEAVRRVTLRYDEVQKKWTLPEHTGPEAVLTTFLVTEGKEPLPKPSKPDLAIIKRACRTDTEQETASVEVGEIYDYVVSVRNLTENEIRDIQVSEELNTDLLQLLQNSKDYQNGIWTIPSLPAYGTAVLRLPVKALTACEAYENRVRVFLTDADGSLLELPPGPGDRLTATVRITEKTKPPMEEEPKGPEEPEEPKQPEEPQKPDNPTPPQKNRSSGPDDSGDNEPDLQEPPSSEPETRENPGPAAGVREREEAIPDPVTDPQEKEPPLDSVTKTAPQKEEKEPEDAREVSDPRTPLSEGSHRCCILHFCILLLALLLEIGYMRSRKEHQRRCFELRREIAQIQNRIEEQEET